jgi:DNA-directed RNA polymerase specialized sigma24 family protein
MIGIEDLQTEAGQAEFESYIRSAERFILSRISSTNPGDDARELAQIASTRIWQKMSETGLKVNAGYFIETAKFMLKEDYRRKNLVIKRFGNTRETDEREHEKPQDADTQLSDYENLVKRTEANDYILECLSKLREEEQRLLWRYSYKDSFELDSEEPDNYEGMFYALLNSVREIRRKLMPLQQDQTPLTGNVRLRIFRLREKLKECFANCIDRKHGFS